MMKNASALLLEANLIKKKLVESGSPLNDNIVWTHQKTLQSMYSQLLTQYPDFSLENNVEKDLWNFGFRSTFNQIQSEMQTTKNSTEIKNVFNWFLNSTSGFFIRLLNQICSTNSLDFIFRRKDCSYGLAGGGLSALPGTKVMENSNKNALYICQYCLIHLGDLARYRHQPKQAETFYRHAVTVAPTSGHPYNQLALLEAGKGNKLAAMFFYIRALCVSAPFPGAPSNLAQTLVKILDTKNEFSGDRVVKSSSLVRLSKEEYVRTFLHFYAALLLKGDVQTATEDLSHLTSGLSTLVATTAITKSSLVQMTVISIFAHNFFSGGVNVRIGEDVDMKKEEEQFVNPDSCQKEALEIIENLIFGMLAALMLPVYTMKDPELVVTFIALPAVLLKLDWLLMNKMMNSPALKRKQQIWPGICTLVNTMQSLLKNFDGKKYEDVPLPEHWDLQGFLPLQKYLSNYSYKERIPKMSVEEFSNLRAFRLTHLAQMLAKEKLDSGPVIKIVANKETELLQFETLSNPPVEEVLDLERLTLQPHLEHKNKKDKKDKAGILKVQNLEKAKETKSARLKVKEVAISGKKFSASAATRIDKASEQQPPIILTNDAKVGVPPLIKQKPRTRTNVALQAILKRNSNQDSKQVTFMTNTSTTVLTPTTSIEAQQNLSATSPAVVISDLKQKPSHGAIQNSRITAPVSQSKESQFYPLAKPNDMVNQPCHPFVKLNPAPFSQSSFPSSVPKLAAGSIGQENLRNSFKLQPNPGFPVDQTRFNASEVLGNLGMSQPWNKDMSGYTSAGKTSIDSTSQFPPLRLMASFKDVQHPTNQSSSFPQLPIYMSNFNSANSEKLIESASKPSSQHQSGNGWWPKDQPIRPVAIQLPTQDGPSVKPPSFPTYPSVPVANINVPPPNLSQMFNRPPPPIRLPQSSEPYVSRMSTFPQPAADLQGYPESYPREHPEQFRGSSTYSLFGPLGGVDSARTSAQQVVSPTSHRALPQSLWSGPSPLERLLEQKKYANKSDTQNFHSK